MFGGLPLAIAHIGGHVSDALCSLSDFLELAEQRYCSLWECDLTVSKSSSVKRLEVVWDFALEELPSNAKSLAYTMAFMNPDSMPTVMFLDDSDSRLDKDSALRYEVFERAVAAVRKLTPSASPIQFPNPKLWADFEKAVPQILGLETAFAHSQPSIQGSVAFAQLLYDAAFNTWERESSQDGLRLLTTALAVLNDLNNDPDGKLRADIHVMVGVICDNIGISKRAEAIHHRNIVVRIRQAIVDRGPADVNEVDDILLHNALNDTAETWGSEEQYPFEYGKYYRNKAAVRTFQRRFDEAVVSAKRSVVLAKLDTGIGPRYLMYLQDVASHMLQSGNVAGALKQHMEVFELRERLCGKYHDVTLQSMYAIGAMHYHLKDFPEAEVWFRRTLDRTERTRWPDEPLCRAQYHLSRVIKLQSPNAKRLDEAMTLEYAAKHVLNRLLQHDYPDYLKNVSDELVLLDHLQPAFRGRWTGALLLGCVSSAWLSALTYSRVPGAPTTRTRYIYLPTELFTTVTKHHHRSRL
ncbi:hypothetical protein DL98DRAFT_659889 [Cadophora sp. DSE1049]|nr:hypothetical protein DL98DRAFT_659889 [Cadophora sp. DSE1049]